MNDSVYRISSTVKSKLSIGSKRKYIFIQNFTLIWRQCAIFMPFRKKKISEIPKKDDYVLCIPVHMQCIAHHLCLYKTYSWLYSNPCVFHAVIKPVTFNSFTFWSVTVSFQPIASLPLSFSFSLSLSLPFSGQFAYAERLLRSPTISLHCNTFSSCSRALVRLLCISHAHIHHLNTFSHWQTLLYNDGLPYPSTWNTLFYTMPHVCVMYSICIAPHV